MLQVLDLHVMLELQIGLINEAFGGAKCDQEYAKSPFRVQGDPHGAFCEHSVIPSRTLHILEHR
jgi:hypothetical protein